MAVVTPSNALAYVARMLGWQWYMAMAMSCKGVAYAVLVLC